MPSRSNRNAPRRRNNQHIYPETHDPHSEVDDSTLLSPVAGQPLLTPDSPQPTDYDLEADVERDGVRGLIEFDPDDGVVEGVGTLGLGGVDEAYPTSPSPLSLDPTSRSPVYSDEAPVAIQSGDEGDKGHTRSPVLSKEPTMLESFSRTFRNYVPSSIPVPSAGPTPPRVSRPVSFGSFLTASGAVTSMAPRRGTTTSGKRRDSGTHIHGSPPFEALFESDHEDDLVREGLTSYPSINTDDEIIWARWDSLSDGGMSRILFVGYRAGFQIWDCTSLGSISEFLNLSDAQWGQVTFASVLPSPTASHADRFADDRPLVGIVSHLRGIPECIIYSLRRHRIVKKLSFPGLRTISPNADFIIVSTANPPTLHVISSSSFVTLFSIPSTTLVAFAHPSSTGLHTVSSPIDSSDTTSGSTSTPTSSLPEPVFALSHRLLAFVSTSPPPDSPTDTVVQPRTGTPSSDRGAQLFGVSQADLEHAAVKVGGTVLSGMKILGGMAYSAARSRMSGTSGRLGGSDAPPVVGAANMVFSKSAPAESGGDHERRNSMSTGTSNQDESSSKGLAGTSPSGVAPRNPSMKSSASTAFVTILDLRPLLSSRPPVIVSRFAALRDQPICRLQFSADGTSILAVPKDGRVAKIFQIRSNPNPSPSATRLDQVSSRSASERPRHHPQSGDNAPWHVYDLVRGRTSATVEDLDWAYDGRWIAIGTGNRTIHVFAVNPYGGRPDGRSHLNSRVYNTSELQPLSMEVTPVVRLRSRRPTNPASVTPFVFLRPDTDIPLSLRPLSSHPSSPSSTSRASSPPRKSLSPVPRQQGSSSFQDVLVFDTDDGTLSLRRFVMDQVVGEHNLDSVPPGTTSTSFPGVSSIGRLSTPPSDRTSTLTVSGLSKMMEKPLDLVGRDSVVATWSLRRGRGWPDVRTVIKSREAFIAPVRPRKFDWLSQAELSTHSRSPRILPRSIYLSHQLSFHSLAEDYHALIRRYQLDVPTSKIEVRKQVAASAFPTGSGESFIYGTQSPSEARMISSSFDEPLASALSADIDYNSASPPVIPMLPNGTSGSRPKSFGNAIPIRSVTSGLSDGMTEGIGRIRREIGKVRSPRLLPRPDRGTTTASVPLEFEEVDEDFLNPVDDPMSHEDTSVSRSTSRGDSAPSVSTPSTTAVPLEDDDSWNRWDPEDKQIVDDAERFDDIVVGFMDEEQATMHESSSRRRRHFA